MPATRNTPENSSANSLPAPSLWNRKVTPGAMANNVILPSPVSVSAITAAKHRERPAPAASGRNLRVNRNHTPSTSGMAGTRTNSVLCILSKTPQANVCRPAVIKLMISLAKKPIARLTTPNTTSAAAASADLMNGCGS